MKRKINLLSFGDALLYLSLAAHMRRKAQMRAAHRIAQAKMTIVEYVTRDAALRQYLPDSLSRLFDL